ncbi:TrkH family potassium uptake protein [Marinicrinis sediminis]|uniref:TrkH family potassium uptake protein n=1 Tax=Marinicrinis sediminis TaxID=1652465 RepID=A0ABW5RFD6_9BACL
MKRRHAQFAASRFLVNGFMLVTIVGALLLSLPIASEKGQDLSFIDALFTSTSAVCVTGLIVIDTPSQFSVFGEMVIMVLIQIGGLGFMTFSVLIAVLLGKRIGLRERMLLQQSTNAVNPAGVVKLSLGIFFIALVVETVAAAILTIRFAPDLGWSRASYYAVFHAISAFNNAGFSLWPDNLMRYVGDPVVNMVITMLFLIGGIGFFVVLDVIRKRKWVAFSLHTKIVLSASLFLCVAGPLVITLIEWFNPKTFGMLSFSERLWAGYFQGVVTRTAGFNTLNIPDMMTASQFVMIFFMFIGASSGSTGGGIKTNTMVILLLSIWSTIRGEKHMHIFKRRIAIDLVFRALAVVMISIMVVLLSALLLTLTEHSLQKDFMEILFESTSAFATVGLSMGLTYELSFWGKVVIIATMFIGRLGPLTLAYAMSQTSNQQDYKYVEEKLMIG